MKSYIATSISIFVSNAVWSVVCIGMITGWISNLIWLLTHGGVVNTEFWVALVGTVVAPLGALHGLYVLF